MLNRFVNRALSLEDVIRRRPFLDYACAANTSFLPAVARMASSVQIIGWTGIQRETCPLFSFFWHADRRVTLCVL